MEVSGGTALQVLHVERTVARGEKFQVVRDEKDGPALVGLGPEKRCNGGHIGAVESACGLVENEDGRVLRERTGNDDALFFAAGKALRMALGERRKPQVRQNARALLTIFVREARA